MKKTPSFVDQAGIPVFTAGDFFGENQNIYIHKSTELPEYVGVVHKHAFIEIVFVLSGYAEHYTPDSRFEVSKGDLIMIEQNTPHAFYQKTDAAEPFVAYDLSFTPDCIDTSLINLSSFNQLCSSYIFYSLFPSERSFGPTLKLSGNNYKYFGDIFERIYREYNTAAPGYLALIRVYVTELIVKMLRSLNRPEKNTLPHKKQTVDEIIAYFNKHFDQKIKLDEIARMTFFSKDYLSRFFKDITGQNIPSFLNSLRLKKVCDKLVANTDTVSDIAQDCGFEDLSFFYKLFKSQYNMTPLEFRLKYSGKNPPPDNII